MLLLSLQKPDTFINSVTSLRGRYEAFSSVMSDLEKFANRCNETKVANANLFEVFEQRYCNQCTEIHYYYYYITIILLLCVIFSFFLSARNNMKFLWIFG